MLPFKVASRECGLPYLSLRKGKWAKLLEEGQRHSIVPGHPFCYTLAND